ncbi:TraR/DksA family transcriptional regulator [Rhizobium sp. SSA_523]|uniref:TraR/DksA family transcriptional regulator n=1 Tax=Rhizobium sp. SSA_523 TaxID=2952477 RepID=UPI002090DBC7|nr:TraR/DksA family transcriptional regulator [Rhizobium sp. SSA_523]MCO5731920.1 TraR/DksA family transcriptional regulator [Rhizobium sp. SSA_523]WKC25708.1 TraR/DksA family transcriptional regulator [Rhizobium sp. SSA_523]
MNSADYKARLQARQAELRRRLERIETDLDEPRNPDDDDRAVERNNDEVLEGLGDAGQRELIAVDAALGRISAGTYGVCARCGEPISEKRLDAVPHAALCADCAASA